MNKKYKIVAVDDEMHVVELLKHSLEREEFIVLEAYNGQEALELIKKEKSDLILLDRMMPHMSGDIVLRKLKENDETKDIPVIVLTAKDTQSDRIEGLNIGAYEYITKPVDI